MKEIKIITHEAMAKSIMKKNKEFVGESIVCLQIKEIMWDEKVQ